MFVSLSFVVGLVTFAIIRAGSIDAILRTDASNIDTLVDVGASFAIGHQFVTGIASASVFNGRVYAELSALMNFHLEAFVNSARERFVAVVGAIGNFVTDERVINTLGTVGAFELAFGTQIFRRDSRSAKSIRVGTIPLVGKVPAIIFLITPVGESHAFGVLTGELSCRAAGAIFAIAFGSFIRSITAIVVVIASLILVHTPSVAAGKLFGSASAPLSAIESRSGRHVLIGSIDAIRIAVTDPFLGNALSFAPLLVGAAGEFCFGVAFTRSALMPLILVGIVETIVVTVADVNAGNTIAVVAGE